MQKTINLFDNKHWENADDYFPGTKRKVLRNENRNRTVLLKLPEGFVIPPHSHITTEQHIILEGEYVNNGKHFTAGSYQLISPGEQHGSFSSEQGATILVIWDPIKVKNYHNTKLKLEDVVDEISKIEHPSIKSSLINLGIVSDIVLTNNKVTLVVAFATVHIPITYNIINYISKTIQEMGLRLEYTVREMTEKEIARFEKIKTESKTR